MAKALGILLPIQRGNTGYFNQGRDITTQMKSNLTNLLLTKRGERIMQPNFGCDVHSLVFEPLTDDTIANIRGSIDSAIKTWMPFITVVDMKVQKDETYNNVFVQVTFSISTNPTMLDTITLKF